MKPGNPATDLSPFEDLLGAFERLRTQGHLDRRRTDLLSITGHGRDEIAHSQVIRWLFDPAGSHGLGSALLRAILVEGWGTEAAAEVHLAIADREITRLKTRADVIVELGSTTLVIENKVDAPEQPTQCEDFFRHWGTRGRYLLLSPGGGQPSSAKSAEARRAWRSLSYGAFARLLADHVARATGPGRVALADYVEALTHQFPHREAFSIGREDDMSDALGTNPDPARFDAPDPFDTPRLRFFLSHQPAINEIGALEKEFKAELEREIQGLLGPIQQSLIRPDDQVEGALFRWGGGGPKHPMFWRPSWVGTDGLPRAGIGLAWDRLDLARNSVYTGLFARDLSPGSALEQWLRKDQASTTTDDWVPGLYPVAYRYVLSQPGWWTDLPAWRARIADDVEAAWMRFGPRVDAAVAQLDIGTRLGHGDGEMPVED